MPEPLSRTFLIPHVAPTIIPATDPGVVSVLKRGAVFLLTDQPGDSVPNSEGLGLYLGDTRMLSCLVLLVNGERPSVLRPDPGGGATGTIALTNPDPSPDPRRHPRQERTLAARSIGLVRERWLVAGLHERLALANYTDHAKSPTIDLLLDADWPTSSRSAMAAQAFPDARLPELFCGFGRGEVGPPVAYPGACAPQAWAAAAPLMILRALLGIRPCAVERRLDLERPLLPDGLASLTLSGLRIGDARVDLHCRRRRGSIRVDVTTVTGELTVAVRT